MNKRNLFKVNYHGSGETTTTTTTTTTAAAKKKKKTICP